MSLSYKMFRIYIANVSNVLDALKSGPGPRWRNRREVEGRGGGTDGDIDRPDLPHATLHSHIGYPPPAEFVPLSHSPSSVCTFIRKKPNAPLYRHKQVQVFMPSLLPYSKMDLRTCLTGFWPMTFLFTWSSRKAKRKNSYNRSIGIIFVIKAHLN